MKSLILNTFSSFSTFPMFNPAYLKGLLCRAHINNKHIDVNQIIWNTLLDREFIEEQKFQYELIQNNPFPYSIIQTAEDFENKKRKVVNRIDTAKSILRLSDARNIRNLRWAQMVIFRDYVTNKFAISSFFYDNGFVHIKPYAVSLIKIPDNCSGLDDYLHLSLTKKHRNTYKRLLRERSIQNTSLGLEYDFDTNIERLYRLYLNVNKKANEFKSSPIPQTFFISLKRKFGKNCFCIVMKNRKNDIVGFVLVIQNNYMMIPFLMGIDYNYRSLHIWHNLTLECIKYAIDNQIKEIDLGLTNYELKKRLGAKKYDINMLARFRSNIINRYFNFALSKLI